MSLSKAVKDELRARARQQNADARKRREEVQKAAAQSLLGGELEKLSLSRAIEDETGLSKQVTDAFAEEVEKLALEEAERAGFNLETEPFGLFRMTMQVMCSETLRAEAVRRLKLKLEGEHHNEPNNRP